MSLKKAVLFFLLIFWTAIALWVEFIPQTIGTKSALLRNFFNRVDYLVYDTRLLATIKAAHRPPYRIAIVMIDQNTIQKVGEFPWVYNKLADLIRKIRAHGSAVIATDIVLTSAPSNLETIMENELRQGKYTKSNALLQELETIKSTHNQALIKEIENKQDIVLPFMLTKNHDTDGQLPAPMLTLKQRDLNKISILKSTGYITNFKALQQVSTNNGFITYQPDSDGVIRRMPLILRYQDKIYPCLALSVAEAYLSVQHPKLSVKENDNSIYLTSIQLDGRSIPTDKFGQVPIPFYGSGEQLAYYSAMDVLDDHLKPDVFKNTIVLISMSAVGFENYKNTPVNSMLPSIEIHANMLSGLLSGELPYVPYWAQYLILSVTLIVGVMFALILPLLTPIYCVVFSFVVLSILLIGNIVFWVKFHLVLAFSIIIVMVIMQLITAMTYGFLFESGRKKLLQKVFSEYVPKEHINILLENPEAYGLEGDSAELTVLFSDIWNFTTISEKLDANRIKNMLNQFLTPITDSILKHGGTIDKYVGDMIIAFWGAPIKNPRHREFAIDAALDMLKITQQLNIHNRQTGSPEIRIGIGVNSGIMNVGDMGSEFRRAYTVLGDPVNLGARLERATRIYDVDLIVGSATRAGQTKFLFRWLDRVQVKGKSISTDIYEVIGRMSHVTPEQIQEVQMHEEALDAYCNADWACAIRLFDTLAKEHPNSAIYKIFLKRIHRLNKKPVPSDWDGSSKLE